MSKDLFYITLSDDSDESLVLTPRNIFNIQSQLTRRDMINEVLEDLNNQNDPKIALENYWHSIQEAQESYLQRPDMADKVQLYGDYPRDKQFEVVTIATTANNVEVVQENDDRIIEQFEEILNTEKANISEELLNNDSLDSHEKTESTPPAVDEEHNQPDDNTATPPAVDEENNQPDDNTATPPAVDEERNQPDDNTATMTAVDEKYNQPDYNTLKLDVDEQTSNEFQMITQLLSQYGEADRQMLTGVFMSIVKASSSTESVSLLKQAKRQFNEYLEQVNSRNLI